MSEELKTCPNPWCEPTLNPITISERDSKGDFTLLAKRCVDCGVQSPAKPTLDEAIAAWNTRADDTLRAENEMRTAELDFAVEKMAAYRSENELLREAVKVADDAINEMFRYFDGGETRGSYDGNPERAQLRKAGYATRNALSRVVK